MRARMKRRQTMRRVTIIAAVVGVIVLFAVAFYVLTRPSYLDSFVNKPVGQFPGNSLQTLKQAAVAPYGSGGSTLVGQVRSLNLSLISHGKPVFLYVGEDGCPYCAVMRWEIVIALLRFGNFSNLSYMTSFLDGTDYPTYSFHGSTYSSPYVAFAPYETSDRTGGSLDTIPQNYTSIFNSYSNNGGVPFTYVAGKYYVPGALLSTDYATIDSLNGLFAGKNWTSITTSLGVSADPLGSMIKAGANVLTAKICKVLTTPDPSVCEQGTIATLSSHFSPGSSPLSMVSGVSRSTGLNEPLTLIPPSRGSRLV